MVKVGFFGREAEDEKPWIHKIRTYVQLNIVDFFCGAALEVASLHEMQILDKRRLDDRHIVGRSNAGTNLAETRVKRLDDDRWLREIETHGISSPSRQLGRIDSKPYGRHRRTIGCRINIYLRLSSKPFLPDNLDKLEDVVRRCREPSASPYKETVSHDICFRRKCPFFDVCQIMDLNPRQGIATPKRLRANRIDRGRNDDFAKLATIAEAPFRYDSYPRPDHHPLERDVTRKRRRADVRDGIGYRQAQKYATVGKGMTTDV